MGRDAWQGLPADVAKGGPGVGAGVPVVHAGEVLHVELGCLEQSTAIGGSSHKKHIPILCLICPRRIGRLNPRYPTQALPAGSPSHNHLIDFPFLDRLQSPDPVLHFLPVLCTKNEFSERGDHLREGRQKSPAVDIHQKPSQLGLLCLGIQPSSACSPVSRQREFYSHCLFLLVTQDAC